LSTPHGQLLERARGYDAQALAEIYDSYAESIYRYLFRYVGDAGHAEDLTSEVFLKLLQVLNTPRAPRDNLPGWLYRVAHNQAMDWFRGQGKQVATTLDDDVVPRPQAEVSEDMPLAALERRQSQEQLREAIRQLTPDQQRVILLRFGEGLKCAQVAELMGKSEGAIKVLQHRAVKHLRKLLGRQERGA
jgi:RNA polymerase sigma-70 factor (ECF subfamily)